MNKEQKSFQLSMGDSQNTNAVIGTVFFFILLGGGFWFYYGGGWQTATKDQMQEITNMVAEDSVKEYNIAKAGGDKIDICVHAGLVSAAYIQAKDQANYLVWKEIEKNDCAAAGLPR